MHKEPKVTANESEGLQSASDLMMMFTNTPHLQLSKTVMVKEPPHTNQGEEEESLVIAQS